MTDSLVEAGEKNIPVGKAQRPCRFDIFAAKFRQCRAACGAGVCRPFYENDCENNVADAFPEQRKNEERRKDGGKGKLKIDHAHHCRLRLAAGIGGCQAESGADDEGDGRRSKTDDQADPQTVENSGKHVAPLIVRAEQESEAGGRLRSRRHAAIHYVKLHQVVGILRRQHRREDRQQDDKDDQDEANKRER